MKLCAKVVATMRQWLAIVRAFALMAGAHLDTMLFKFMTNKNSQAVL
jgi:hypothetical protein